MTLTDKNTGKLVHSWVSGTEPEKLVMTGNTGEVLVAGHTHHARGKRPGGLCAGCGCRVLL